jgi:hypothetical protein
MIPNRITRNIAPAWAALEASNMALSENPQGRPVRHAEHATE